MLGAPIRRRAVVPAFIALLAAAVVVPGTVDAQEAAPETDTYWLSLDVIQGNWIRVESNNPRNNGMRIRVEGDRATITAMPPRGSSRLSVGQVVWKDLSTFDSGSGSLAVRGSDGAYYLSEMTITEITGVRGQATRLAIDVDKENSPGNDQTWVYAGPSIDGDWVLVDGFEVPRDRGLRVRVEGDRATIRYVPATAGREFRVGDLLWRNIGSGDHSDLNENEGRLEALSGGGSYEPASYRRMSRDGSPLFISPDVGDWQYWYRPEDAERRMAAVDEEDEDEGALLDLRHEPVGDPPAQDPDLEPSDDTKTVDNPDPTPALSEQSSVLTGVVFQDLDGNGTRDGGEPGLPGVTIVTVRVSDEDRSTLTTDADGRYRLEVTGGINRRISVDESSLPFDGTLTTRFDPYHATIPPGSSSDNADFGYREEEPAACLETSLPYDGTGVSWGWGLTASDPTPGSVNSVLPSDADMNRRYDMAIDLERSHVQGLDDHHSYIWRANPADAGGGQWEVEIDLDLSAFEAKNEEYRDSGLRLADLEIFFTLQGLRLSGLWTPNTDQVDWSWNPGLRKADYDRTYEERRAEGYRLIDMEPYETPTGRRYAALWYKSCADADWDHDYDMDRDSYQETVEAFRARGFQVVEFESYRTSDGQRYAAIWEDPSTPRAWRVRSDRSLTWFLNYHRQYVDEGFRLVEYESYETEGGIRYAGVWAENDPRYRFPAKDALDSLIEDYRDSNDLPGISVVAMQDGEVVYRRGFGFADREAQKQAHSGTVFLSASVSKVIGAALAARLQEKGVGGLDLSKKTSDYLAEMPSHHTHSVEQLLSKTACVHHYDEGPEPNVTNYYQWRMPALEQIWSSELLDGCTPGQHYHYSTHGFTFLGAVLEAVSDKPVADLLQDEFAQGLGLNSMRAIPASGGNYERAKPYRLQLLQRDTRSSTPDTLLVRPGPVLNPSNPTSYENSSWKVLGGGIETNALDLARFGWMALDGTIVSNPEVMFQVRTGGARNWRDDPDDISDEPDAPRVGLAWVIRGQIAWHGGSARGARSGLRIWRNDGVVVAILSNRRNHRVDDIRTLADRIGTLVIRGRE